MKYGGIALQTTKVGNGNGVNGYGGGGGGKKTRKSSDFKEQRKQVKVHDVKEQPRNQLLSGKQFPKQDDGVTTQRPPTSINVKPVDEDLYKIPPKLLHSSKRVSPLSKCYATIIGLEFVIQFLYILSFEFMRFVCWKDTKESIYIHVS